MFRFKATDLDEILKRVSFSVSKDSNRHHITGVLFEHDDTDPNDLTSIAHLVTTDGHRLTELTFKETHAKRFLDAGSEGFSIHVPWPMLKGLLVDPSHYDTITISDTEIRGMYFGVKRYKDDFPFPAYRKVVPKNLPNKIRFDRKKMITKINELKKVASDTSSIALVCDADMNSTYIQMPERPAAEGDPDSRCIDDLIASSSNLKDNEIRLATKYLYEPLSKSKAEVVTIRFGGPLDPLLLETSEEFHINGAQVIAERVCVLMPRR